MKREQLLLYTGVAILLAGVGARLFLPDVDIEAAWLAITIGGTLAGVAVPARKVTP